MNPQELRIGNLVSVGAEIIMVESINEDGINLRAGDGPSVYPDYEFKELKPITLTNEWLLKFGFESDTALSKGPVKIWHSYYEDCFYFRFGHDSQVIVKHVQDLQNLYFSLTGEELTIKELTNQ